VGAIGRWEEKGGSWKVGCGTWEVGGRECEVGGERWEAGAGRDESGQCEVEGERWMEAERNALEGHHGGLDGGTDSTKIVESVPPGICLFTHRRRRRRRRLRHRRRRHRRRRRRLSDLLSDSSGLAQVPRAPARGPAYKSRTSVGMASNENDFSAGALAHGASGKGSKRSIADMVGQDRPWLRVYETVPAQMLNVYGEAKFGKLGDAAVWDQLRKPLKTGAMYATEFASKEPERRGVAINRWMHAVLSFVEYQKTKSVQDHNKFIMREELFNELYTEIDTILPPLQYCLAPKKVSVKSGAASLRSNAVTVSTGEVKDQALLDKHGKVLWDWLDVSQRSRIRMLMMWQAASGLSFVATCHHRAAQCFRYHGNSADGLPVPVTLEEFQAGIKLRHTHGSSGIDGDVERFDRDWV
jgi:hypothetical protein